MKKTIHCTIIFKSGVIRKEKMKIDKKDFKKLEEIITYIKDGMKENITGVFSFGYTTARISDVSAITIR